MNPARVDGKKNLWIKNLVLVIMVVALAVMPVVILEDAEFTGTDDRAGKIINNIAPGYTPWAENIWEPPGSEVESLLFVVQGALGAGLIGYCLGYLRGRKKRED